MVLNFFVMGISFVPASHVESILCLLLIIILIIIVQYIIILILGHFQAAYLLWFHKLLHR